MTDRLTCVEFVDILTTWAEQKPNENGPTVHENVAQIMMSDPV